MAVRGVLALTAVVGRSMPTLYWLCWVRCYWARCGRYSLLLRERGEGSGARGRARVERGEGLLHGLQLWLLRVVGGLLRLKICRLGLLLLLTIVWILVAIGMLLVCCVGMGGVGGHGSKRGSSGHGLGGLLRVILL